MDHVYHHTEVCTCLRPRVVSPGAAYGRHMCSHIFAPCVGGVVTPVGQPVKNYHYVSMLEKGLQPNRHHPLLKRIGCNIP